MFKEINTYLKRYYKLTDFSKPLFALNLISAIAYKGLNLIRPIIASLIVKSLMEQNASNTYLFIGIYTAVYVAYRISLYLNFKAYSLCVRYTYCQLQTKIFEKLIHVDGDFTRKISKGRLMNTINTDLINLGEMYDEIAEYYTTIFQLLAVVIISATYNIPIAILMCVSMIIYTAIRTRHDRKFNFYWWKTQARNDEYSNFLGQVVTGRQEVKTFNMLPKLRARLDRIQSKYTKAYKSQRHHVVARDNDVKVSFYLFQTLFYLILIICVLNGWITVDVLILLISYHEAIISNAKDFTDATIEIRLTGAAITRVSSVLNYRSGKQEEFGDLDLDDLLGNIEFKNVSLTLDKQKILRNINLKIRHHEVVAIVGFPGSGKTKLIDLILRINKPTHGQILLDQIDINEFSREVFTSNIAVANQSPFIFNTSIRKNLDFINTDIPSQIEACKIAGIHDFIETLPQGYNTILRENATNISGGQKQMISIARTILTEAEILLFDDITTALDPDTAKLVPRLIKKLKEDHTIIMITKKPDLMKNADRIVVLHEGKISDVGTHTKLMERSQIYRALQASKSQTGDQNV